MKNKFFIKGLVVISLLCVLLLMIWNLFATDKSNIISDNIDKYLKVNKLNDKAIIVSLGYDAVTAIKTQKGIVVIDAGISNSLTAKYRKVIEREFKRDDFAYLINTHSHPDHVGGNQVFSDVKIAGHENCISEMSEYWRNMNGIKVKLKNIAAEYEIKLKTFNHEWEDSLEIIFQKVRYNSTYVDLLNSRIVTVPTLVFKDTLNLSTGDITFNLIYFGKAHSGSDIIVHIPELKILMTGDLFFPGGRPSIKDVNKKDLKRWLIVKEWINNRWDEIDRVIGGHGQIMTRDDLKSFIVQIFKEGEI